ncbi:hypothetical protein OF83DRAFT_1168008 [Amylostereum chailletii]|nr:hypothetical protein OF83DRAFT_1168008 [Amylostereum chailletii]
MTVSTTSAAVYITPVVFKTFAEHYKKKSKRKLKSSDDSHEEATDELFFDEAFHIVKAFIELGTKSTIESLQAFTNTHIPAPFWAVVIPITIPLVSCNCAADLLIGWFGPEELTKIVGGARWWQVRGLDGIDAEWITEKSFLDGNTEKASKKASSDEDTISQMDKLESVMLYVHGGGFFWGSINTHRYQIIRYARKIKGRAFAVNYRKAPQYPWPCPLHDVLAAYFYLIDPPAGSSHKAIHPSKIVFAGDSAGAALCVTALTVLRDMGIPQPAGAILISPWVDLTHSFQSVMDNMATDIMPPYGFVHRPSLAWPLDPVGDADHPRVTQSATNPPPPPGHADTLLPSPERVDEQHANKDAAVKGSDKLHDNNGVKTQQGMFDQVGGPTASDPEYIPGNSQASENNSSTSDGTLRETQPPEDADGTPKKWEPKPAKVLMENSSAVPLEIRGQIQQYATNEQLTHPLVSPILQGSLCNLCPLYILAGDGEVLRDEIVRFAHRAAHPDDYPTREGVVKDGRQRDNVEKFRTPTNVHLQVYDGMPHVLTVFSFTESANYVYRSIAQFARHVTMHGKDHLASSPFPDVRRQECQIHADEPSHQEDNGRPHTPQTFEQAKADVVSGQDAAPCASLGGRRAIMIRERVDIHGQVRSMEALQDIPALQMPSSAIGIIKEAPVRRWLTGQELTDKKFVAKARKVVKKRHQVESRVNRMLAEARAQGFLLVDEGGSGALGVTVMEGNKAAKTMVSSVSANSGVNGGIRIDEHRRWGPLDLQDERPPPSAIAGRRDTPEALALIKKHVYHSAPVTHKTIPKMRHSQTVRAAFDPLDLPSTAPRQSVSEEQTRTHIIPIHGLTIWNSLVGYFVRRTSSGKALLSTQTTEVAGNTVRSERNGLDRLKGKHESSSKLSVSSVRGSIKDLLADATGEKRRNFVETIELQIGLKNYDPQRDKRFSGTVKLPNVPRPRMSICILADAADIDRAKQIDLEYMSVDDLKKLNKNKKLVKKLAKKYDAFLASEALIKQIPRLLGPGLSKAGKFPTPVSHAEDLSNKLTEVRSTIKFQLKKVLCLGVAVGHVQMTDDQVLANVMLSINFLVSLLKKNWQNVKSLHIKSTMGKPIRLF